jgi:DNA-binding NtrC family response regulator
MSNTVLVVDNDELLLRMLGSMLGSQFAVTTAASVDEAIDWLGRIEFSAVVSDLELTDPSRSGVWLLGQAREKLPTARRVLISGHLVNEGEAEVAHEVLAKPFTRDALIGAVRG